MSLRCRQVWAVWGFTPSRSAISARPTGSALIRCGAWGYGMLQRTEHDMNCPLAGMAFLDQPCRHYNQDDCPNHRGAVIGGLALLGDRWLMRHIDGSEGG